MHFLIFFLLGQTWFQDYRASLTNMHVFFVIILIAWTNKSSPDTVPTSSTTRLTFDKGFNIWNAVTNKPVEFKKKCVVLCCLVSLHATFRFGLCHQEGRSGVSGYLQLFITSCCSKSHVNLDLEGSTSALRLPVTWKQTPPLWHSLTDSSVRCTGL